MSLKNVFTLLFLVSLFTTVSAQENNPFSKTLQNDNIVMTWNKNTPETEMKDDIKALSDKGITIKYSNVKRNSKQEITAIKVEFADRKGNKGSLVYENQNPISTIKFFKQDDEIGFGEPSASGDFFAGNSMMNGFSDPRELMKQFQFNNGGGDSQSFSFTFPDGQNFSQSKSQIKIQKDGKKPLVIENGEIVEGGDDYTKEELEEIKKNNKVENFGSVDGFSKQFDFRNENGLQDFKKQMQKMQDETNKLKSYDGNSEMDATKNEMLKAKEELIKAREEMEKAKKELEKSRQSLKTQKL